MLYEQYVSRIIPRCFAASPFSAFISRRSTSISVSCRARAAAKLADDDVSERKKSNRYYILRFSASRRGRQVQRLKGGNSATTAEN